MAHVPWARELARQLLAEALPGRWSHTVGVARQAESIAAVVGADADLLVAAAWLHDIGYSPGLVRTGFHPLDGARHLRDVEGVDGRLCRLVANHTFALIEAANRGLASDLQHEFPAVDGLVTDALTYADMTTSPAGELVTVETRLSEIIARYGDGDVVSESIEQARGQIMGSATRVEAVLGS